jgi:hypothetical protein
LKVPGQDWTKPCWQFSFRQHTLVHPAHAVRLRRVGTYAATGYKLPRKGQNSLKVAFPAPAPVLALVTGDGVAAVFMLDTFWPRGTAIFALAVRFA